MPNVVRRTMLLARENKKCTFAGVGAAGSPAVDKNKSGT
jgi:hypothetical protein